MVATNPAARIAPPLNRPLLRRSPLSSLHFASTKLLFLGNHTPSSAIVAVRCQKPVSDNVGSIESTNHVSSVSSSIDFLTLCHRLKTTKRKGWINQGINGPESIADHMYRMAIMALIAGDLEGVNRERCIKMAIVHDIAEAIVGDITPSDGVPKAEKNRRETAALKEMCKVLGGGVRAEEITELWLEYENNASLEANLVKDFDKVEMILQALEYESEHGKVLDEFFISTAGKFQTEIGKSWAAEINARRKCDLTDKQR
ncbi:unnamed protein product [Cochlearia groenlandica]